MPDAPSPGASLTVLGGPLKGKTLLLEDAVDEILVGSDPDSKFCLDVPASWVTAVLGQVIEAGLLENALRGYDLEETVRPRRAR